MSQIVDQFYPAKIPFFGARKLAAEQSVQIQKLEAALQQATENLARLGVSTVLEMEAKRAELQVEITSQRQALLGERDEARDPSRSML